MTGRSLLSGAMFVALGVAAGAATWWVLNLSPAGAKKTAASALPASVPKVFKEDQANVVTLTPEAVKSVTIQTAKVTRKPMPQSRVYGGEVMVPAGQTFVVSAPVGGTLSAPKGGIPKPGSTVKKGDMIFTLAPLLTPEGRVSLATAKIDAEGQVESSQAAYDAAKFNLDRSKRLLKSETGSRRNVEDAQAAHDVAKKTLEAAQARRAMLRKVSDNPDKENAPLTIESPDTGVLRNASASPGQNVHGGANLFEVINLDRVWVRVPVYVGDAGSVDADAAARVFALTARAGTAGEAASPTKAPPSANAAAGTVDLFYEMSNAPAYSPGQRVGVRLTLKGEEDSLTVPWAAVLFDVYGGAWVYEQTGERTFTRQRVVVRFVRDGTAVLKVGPKVGATVVTAGPAELFGSETGFSK